MTLLASLGVAAWLISSSSNASDIDIDVSMTAARSTQRPDRESISPHERVEALLTPSSDGQPSCSVEVVVVDSLDQPISEATVVGDTPAGIWPVGTTDTTGKALINIPCEGVRALVIRASGFAVGHQDIFEPPPSTLRFRLADASTIAGRVRNPDGGAVAGADVVAWRIGCMPSPSAVAWNSVESLHGSRTRTDATGRFILDGLDRHESYSVRAFGPGLLSATADVINPDSTTLEMIVEHVYGVVVKLVSEDGSPPRADPRLIYVGPATTTPRQGTMLSQRRYELALSGVPWDLLGPLQRDARIVLQRCPADVPSIGPISYVAELPGYERVETLVDLGNLRGGLPSLSLVVTPHAADFGSLAIEFTGLPEPGEIAHAGLTGTVTLTSRTGEAYDVYIADSPREVPPFEGVPIGDYTIRFTPDHGLLSTMQSDSTAKAVQIVEGRTARASIDLSETGSLEVQVLDSRGTIHRGLAVFRLRRLSSGVPSKDSIVDFERGPYTIRSLPPGEYTITMDAPFKARSPQAAVVEVVPGMTGIWMQESDP